MVTSLMTIWDYKTHTGHTVLEEGVMNCLFDIMPDKKVNK